MTVNERIKAAIEDSGLKQTYIAKNMGVSEPVLSSIINGKRKVSVEDFFALCNVLKMPAEQLWSYEAV